MFLELNRRDRDVLLELAHSRLANADAQLREGRSTSPQLQEMKRRLTRLVHRLHEAEWDVTC